MLESMGVRIPLHFRLWLRLLKNSQNEATRTKIGVFCEIG